MTVFNSLRLLVCFSVYFCAVFLCVTVAAEDYPYFPHSDTMKVVVVAKNMNVNGIPMRAFTFKTRDNEQGVVDFYKNKWGEEMTDVAFGDWRILSHREGDYLLTVQIEQSEHLMTHGTLGITPAFRMMEVKPTKIKKLKSNIGNDFPTLPGTVFINDIDANDAGKQSRTLFFSNKSSVSKNMRYYKKRMMEKGWVVLGPEVEGTSGNAAALILNRSGEKMNFSFVRRDGLTYGVAVTLK